MLFEDNKLCRMAVTHGSNYFFPRSGDGKIKKRSSLAGRISSKHGVHSQPRLRSRAVRKQEI